MSVRLSACTAFTVQCHVPRQLTFCLHWSSLYLTVGLSACTAFTVQCHVHELTQPYPVSACRSGWCQTGEVSGADFHPLGHFLCTLAQGCAGHWRPCRCGFCLRHRHVWSHHGSSAAVVSSQQSCQTGEGLLWLPLYVSWPFFFFFSPFHLPTLFRGLLVCFWDLIVLICAKKCECVYYSLFIQSNIRKVI